MTAQPLPLGLVDPAPTVEPAPAGDLAQTPRAEPAPRPGSRAARLAMPRSVQVLKDLAVEYGVCIRPVSLRRTDLDTGQTELVDLPCGATREDKCPSCAKRARRLRQVQIREGWHRTDEPDPGPQAATDEQRALIELRAHFEYERARSLANAEWHQVTDLDEGIAEVDAHIVASGLRGRAAPSHTPDPDDTEDEPAQQRRVRSTRRRQDAPDLPRQRVDPRTVGRTYTAPDGREHRPSMWLTLTLDSYGPVHGQRRSSGGKPMPCPCRHTHPDGDPLLGTPIDPNTYDYQRAAWDAVHFPRLLDRFWQNLRRAVGWNVQYAGCVEPQKRLAPHAHFAIRGTIPRTLLERAAAATYHQVWWPTVDQPRHSPEHPPVWDETNRTWIDPDTHQPLPTWDTALDAIDDDPDAEPAHVVGFGPQIKARGVNPDSRDVDRTIGYITKYVTKAAADCHQTTADAQREHLDRLWHALRVTPCSERCANWLLYGIQPTKAHGKLRPGCCKGKIHQQATLGIGGRRILVSRNWSGKTLADHRYDAKAWVRALLGVSTTSDQAPTLHDDQGQPTGDESGNQTPAPTVAWELARHDDPDLEPLGHRLLRAISQRIQWRAQRNAAHQQAGADPPDPVSATGINHDSREEVLPCSAR
ncbi:MAG: replication initiation protein [Dactylosporangium sp.]|nr:replication initiation protein [Dactylosporangium sp.]NNJ59615.1 replication initiation protein [Dactylosporangium sp.]